MKPIVSLDQLKNNFEGLAKVLKNIKNDIGNNNYLFKKDKLEAFVETIASKMNYIEKEMIKKEESGSNYFSKLDKTLNSLWDELLNNKYYQEFSARVYFMSIQPQKPAPLEKKKKIIRLKSAGKEQKESEDNKRNYQTQLLSQELEWKKLNDSLKMLKERISVKDEKIKGSEEDNATILKTKEELEKKIETLQKDLKKKTIEVEDLKDEWECKKEYITEIDQERQLLQQTNQEYLEENQRLTNNFNLLEQTNKYFAQTIKEKQHEIDFLNDRGYKIIYKYKKQEEIIEALENENLKMKTLKINLEIQFKSAQVIAENNKREAIKAIQRLQKFKEKAMDIWEEILIEELKRFAGGIIPLPRPEFDFLDWRSAYHRFFIFFWVSQNVKFPDWEEFSMFNFNIPQSFITRAFLKDWYPDKVERLNFGRNRKLIFKELKRDNFDFQEIKQIVQNKDFKELTLPYLKISASDFSDIINTWKNWRSITFIDWHFGDLSDKFITEETRFKLRKLVFVEPKYCEGKNGFFRDFLKISSRTKFLLSIRTFLVVQIEEEVEDLSELEDLYKEELKIEQIVLKNHLKLIS